MTDIYTEEKWNDVRVRFIAAALTGLIVKLERNPLLLSDTEIEQLTKLAVQFGSSTCADLDNFLAS